MSRESLLFAPIGPWAKSTVPTKEERDAHGWNRPWLIGHQVVTLFDEEGDTYAEPVGGGQNPVPVSTLSGWWTPLDDEYLPTSWVLEPCKVCGTSMKLSCPCGSDCGVSGTLRFCPTCSPETAKVESWFEPPMCEIAKFQKALGRKGRP